MKLTTTFFSIIGLTAIVMAQQTLRSQAQQKPNVILIYTDDQGSLDMNIYGAKDLHTPNMDALARRGVRFTQFYAAAPVCSPSRASLMTGRFPQRAGLATNASSDKNGKNAMPSSQVTMAEMFKNAGYRTLKVWIDAQDRERINAITGPDGSAMMA